MPHSNCVFCNLLEAPQFCTTAGVNNSGSLLGVRCDKCGPYKIGIDVKHHLENDASWGGDSRQRLFRRLSAVIRQAAESGRPPIEITSENMTDVSAMATEPRTYADYVDRITELVTHRAAFPGAVASWSLGELAALTQLSIEHAPKLLRQLINQGLLHEVPAQVLAQVRSDTIVALELTERGWERADRLDRGVHSRRAFVAMSFDPSMRDAYVSGIRPALELCGYSVPFRVDDHEHDLLFGSGRYATRTDDRVIAGIRQAKFVLADVTGHRPAVYYEAGFAEGIGVPVIWSCRRDDLANVCFDTRQNAHLVWDEPSELKIRLEAKIQRAGWDLRL